MLQKTVFERPIVQWRPSMIGSYDIVIPESRRVAIVTRMAKKKFLVVDGQESKQHKVGLLVIERMSMSDD